MSAPQTFEMSRHATLKLTQDEGRQVLNARIPHDLSAEEFGRVAASAYGLVNKLTGCNCMSGRISFVVEDVFADVLRVELGR